MYFAVLDRCKFIAIDIDRFVDDLQLGKNPTY